jgi:hypothetical protein
MSDVQDKASFIWFAADSPPSGAWPAACRLRPRTKCSRRTRRRRKPSESFELLLNRTSGHSFLWSVAPETFLVGSLVDFRNESGMIRMAGKGYRDIRSKCNCTSAKRTTRKTYRVSESSSLGVLFLYGSV